MEVKRGEKFFEWSNHLGNVLATVSDRKIAHSSNSSTIDYYEADVVSAQDYYPFGMIMPGRVSSNQNGYRYGFNGKEIDKEIRDVGEVLDFGARIYDPRIANWLSVDPLQRKYPGESPYLFTGGNPILFIDPDGKDRILFVKIYNQQTQKYTHLKVKLSGELKGELNRVYYSHQNWYSGSSYTDEYKWFDIHMHMDIIIDKDGQMSVKTREEKGNYRTTTSFNSSRWARLWIPTKGNTREGGLILSSSESKHNWDNGFESNARHIDGVVNVDKILSAFSAAGAASNPEVISRRPEEAIEILENIKVSRDAIEVIENVKNDIKGAIQNNEDVKENRKNTKPEPIHIFPDKRKVKVRMPGHRTSTSPSKTNPDTIYHDK